MEKKPSLKVYFTETETHFTQKYAVIVNEDTHPELKGMNIEEMKKYVEENISKMKAVNSEYSANLEDEVMYAEEEWDRYYNESSQTVIEELTEEDLVQNNREEDEDDEEDED
jgi:hypothetical protein